MLRFLQRFFGDDGDERRPPDEHDVRVATCALFVEMASIDGEFSAQETAQILDGLKSRYGLPEEHARTLLDQAQREAAQSIDLWTFTNRINEYYSTDEKLQIVEILWNIVFADGRMDDHEHYLMSKLVGLLRLEHGQVFGMKAKIKAAHANR
ncbi:MAG: TerB family tellurite resistance protein [Myxococcota bacterium]